MAEKEYIERELAKETFQNGKHTVKWLIESGAKTIGDSFAILLDEVPAADVRPVVRGEWVEEVVYYADDGNPCSAFFCNQCSTPFVVKYNFCPNCGCAMEET